MLTFNRRQMSGIGDAHLNQSLADFLRRHFPEAARIPDDELHGTLGTLVRECRSNGLTNQRSIATYVLGSYAMGSDTLLRNPTVSNILGSRFIPQTHKTMLLQTWLTHATNALARIRS